MEEFKEFMPCGCYFDHALCVIVHCPLHAAAPAMLEAAKKLVDYRNRVGPLNFQLEKADDFIRELEAAIAAAHPKEADNA